MRNLELNEVLTDWMWVGYRMDLSDTMLPYILKSHQYIVDQSTFEVIEVIENTGTRSNKIPEDRVKPCEVGDKYPAYHGGYKWYETRPTYQDWLAVGETTE